MGNSISAFDINKIFTSTRIRSQQCLTFSVRGSYLTQKAAAYTVQRFVRGSVTFAEHLSSLSLDAWASLQFVPFVSGALVDSKRSTGLPPSRSARLSNDSAYYARQCTVKTPISCMH